MFSLASGFVLTKAEKILSTLVFLTHRHPVKQKQNKTKQKALMNKYFDVVVIWDYTSTWQTGRLSRLTDSKPFTDKLTD